MRCAGENEYTHHGLSITLIVIPIISAGLLDERFFSHAHACMQGSASAYIGRWRKEGGIHKHDEILGLVYFQLPVW